MLLLVACVHRYEPCDPPVGERVANEGWEHVHRRALLTPDPDLDSNAAIVAADTVLEGDALDVADVVAFAEACRAHAPEDVCASGGAVPGPLL
ncbi:MAG: hypothetical protein ACOZNI_25460 [Myxococcota bacterium]